MTAPHTKPSQAPPRGPRSIAPMAMGISERLPAVADGHEANGEHGEKGDGAVKGELNDLDIAEGNGSRQHEGALGQCAGMGTVHNEAS